MAPALVLPFACEEDLKQLEQQLRELYKVEEHMPCEALLTTEYRMFRHGCLKKLKKLKQIKNLSGKTDETNKTNKTNDIEAFLPGWHLRVTQDECQIQAFRPLVPVGGSKADGSRKRGRDSDE